MGSDRADGAGWNGDDRIGRVVALPVPRVRGLGWARWGKRGAALVEVDQGVKNGVGFFGGLVLEAGLCPAEWKKRSASRLTASSTVTWPTSTVLTPPLLLMLIAR